LRSETLFRQRGGGGDKKIARGGIRKLDVCDYRSLEGGGGLRQGHSWQVKEYPGGWVVKLLLPLKISMHGVVSRVLRCRGCRVLGCKGLECSCSTSKRRYMHERFMSL
jgi:hypothetical protein